MTEPHANPSSVPDVTLISLAIGFAVAATEVSRYTALWTTSLPDVPVKYAVLLVFLALGLAGVTLVGAREGDAPYRSVALRASIAALAMAGAGARWLCLVGVLPPTAACSVLVGIGMEAPYLLMAVIAPLLLRLEPHAAMRAVALGIATAGAVQLAVVALAGSPASYVLVCLFAPASCLFLRAALSRTNGSGNAGEAAPPTRAWSDAIDHRPATFLMLCALCMMALASVVVYFVHAGWGEARTAGASPSAIQLFAGLGVLAAGGVLYLIAPYLRRKDVPEFCFMLIVPVLALSLCLFNLVEGTARIALLVPLNVAYASLLFLTWSFAFTYPSRLRPSLASALAFFVKRAGVLACPALIALSGALGTRPVWLAFWALVALVCLSVTHYIVLHASRRPFAALGDPAGNPGLASTPGASPAPDATAPTLRSVCAAIAAEHGLTPREAEVLALLGRGRTAAYIAETLSVSLPTVRTHIQHIYRKLGVGSQQALLDAIEDRAAQGR